MSTSNSLRKIAKGGALFATGALVATALQFIAGLLVIRIVSPAGFGALSFSVIIVTILSMVAGLGMGAGIPRFIGMYSADSSGIMVGDISGAAMIISLATSIVLALSLYSYAGDVATIFNQSEVKSVLELFSLMIPPLTIMSIISAIYRGLENATAKVIFEDVALYSIRAVLLCAVMILGFGIAQVQWVYIISVWLAFSAYLIYAFRGFAQTLDVSISGTVASQLVRFSLPLLGLGITANLLTWTGTLTLGYFQSVEAVGLFNAALRLAIIIPIPLAAIGYLYLPVASGMIQSGSMHNIKELYVSCTKWAFLLTLPVLIFLIIDADFIVPFLFGDDYLNAVDILRVLVIGFAVHTMLGPNAMTLVANGNTRQVFIGSIVAAISAVLLCLLLVPRFGALGAGIATASSQVLSNVYSSAVLYSRIQLHPFSKELAKPITLATVFSVAGGVILYWEGGTSSLYHLMLFVWIGIVTIMAPIVTRSLTTADLDLLEAVEYRLTGNSNITSRLRVKLGES